MMQQVYSFIHTAPPRTFLSQSINQSVDVDRPNSRLHAEQVWVVSFKSSTHSGTVRSVVPVPVSAAEK